MVSDFKQQVARLHVNVGTLCTSYGLCLNVRGSTSLSIMPFGRW